jgi:hypothetical protein
MSDYIRLGDRKITEETEEIPLSLRVLSLFNESRHIYVRGGYTEDNVSELFASAFTVIKNFECDLLKKKGICTRDSNTCTEIL